jgi:hypothetical protein
MYGKLAHLMEEAAGCSSPWVIYKHEKDKMPICTEPEVRPQNLNIDHVALAKSCRYSFESSQTRDEHYNVAESQHHLLAAIQ